MNRRDFKREAYQLHACAGGYADLGLTAAQAASWANAGFMPHEIERWASVGFGPELAAYANQFVGPVEAAHLEALAVARRASKEALNP